MLRGQTSLKTNDKLTSHGIITKAVRLTGYLGPRGTHHATRTSPPPQGESCEDASQEKLCSRKFSAQARWREELKGGISSIRHCTAVVPRSMQPALIRGRDHDADL